MSERLGATLVRFLGLFRPRLDDERQRDDDSHDRRDHQPSGQDAELEHDEHSEHTSGRRCDGNANPEVVRALRLAHGRGLTSQGKPATLRPSAARSSPAGVAENAGEDRPAPRPADPLPVLTPTRPRRRAGGGLRCRTGGSYYNGRSGPDRSLRPWRRREAVETSPGVRGLSPGIRCG
jgi:hypothetical protein